jgi:DNA-binding NarL/FixJ family response regulator
VSISVLVVDDEPMVCAHLRTILGTAADIDVVEVAHDGAAALEAVHKHRPRVVLMDLRMPGVDGLAATERIVALPDPPAVVALTTFDADQWVLRAMRAGAAGFLVKSTAPEDLIDLVRVAAAGHTVMSPQATRRLVALSGREAEVRRQLDGLTERELEVLTLIGDGRSNAEIGATLYLTEATVKGYVSRLFEKLGCENRTQAARVAFNAGLPQHRDGGLPQHRDGGLPQHPGGGPSKHRDAEPPHRGGPV